MSCVEETRGMRELPFGLSRHYRLHRLCTREYASSSQVVQSSRLRCAAISSRGATCNARRARRSRASTASSSWRPLRRPRRTSRRPSFRPRAPTTRRSSRAFSTSTMRCAVQLVFVQLNTCRWDLLFVLIGRVCYVVERHKNRPTVFEWRWPRVERRARIGRRRRTRNGRRVLLVPCQSLTDIRSLCCVLRLHSSHRLVSILIFCDQRRTFCCGAHSVSSPALTPTALLLTLSDTTARTQRSALHASLVASHSHHTSYGFGDDVSESIQSLLHKSAYWSPDLFTVRCCLCLRLRANANAVIILQANQRGLFPHSSAIHVNFRNGVWLLISLDSSVSYLYIVA